MVTVVKTEPHPAVVKEVGCRNCGATLNYVPNDVKQDYSTDYTGSKDYYNYITCPPCGKKVTVS